MAGSEFLHPDTVPNVDLTTILSEGVLGRFWVIDGKPKGRLDKSAAVSGSVRLLDNEIQAKILIPVGTPVAGRYEPQDRWLVGITDAGTIMMPTVSSEWKPFSFFGERAAIRIFRGPAVIAGVSLPPFGPRITRLSMLLPYPDWAGLDPMSHKSLLDARQRYVGMDIQLRGKGPLACGRSQQYRYRVTGTLESGRRRIGQADRHQDPFGSDQHFGAAPGPPSAHRHRFTNTRLNKPRLRPIHNRRQRACDTRRGRFRSGAALALAPTANWQQAVSQPGGKKLDRSFGSAICESPPPYIVGFDLHGIIPTLPMRSASRTEQIPRSTRDSSSWVPQSSIMLDEIRLKTAKSRQSSGLIGDTS